MIIFFANYIYDLKIRELEPPNKSHFVIYQFQTLKLMNTNPFTSEINLLPGKYIICLPFKSEVIRSKRFFLRIQIKSISGALITQYK